MTGPGTRSFPQRDLIYRYSLGNGVLAPHFISTSLMLARYRQLMRYAPQAEDSRVIFYAINHT